MRNRQDIPTDPHRGTTSSERVYAWQTVPVEHQDRGANDEGYYFDWCGRCGHRTEHEEGDCMSCQ
jgi:hypothetical protein